MAKSKLTSAVMLSTLERVLPKVTPDSRQAAAIYEGVAKEFRLITSLEAFQKFCEKGSLPDSEPETLSGLKDQLEGNFGKDSVTLTPPQSPDDEKVVSVDILLSDRSLTNKIKIIPAQESEEAESPFVPFPVASPDDPELIWCLARRENLGPDEAARALANIETEFWASKKGQRLQRDGVDRSFAEFISNVPASALKDSGIKRYHKDPETLKLLVPAVNQDPV